MNSIINEIKLLEYKINKLNSLKAEYELNSWSISSRKDKNTINSINKELKECNDLLVKKYIELEETKK